MCFEYLDGVLSFTSDGLSEGLQQLVLLSSAQLPRCTSRDKSPDFLSLSRMTFSAKLIALDRSFGDGNPLSFQSTSKLLETFDANSDKQVI